jgi:hypothetical protein
MGPLTLANQDLLRAKAISTGRDSSLALALPVQFQRNSISVAAGTQRFAR